MCCQVNNEAVQSPWCLNVQEAVRLGTEWLLGWLPCLKRHHRVHPSFTSNPECSFVVLDSKKRIRVLHLYPPSGEVVLLSRIRSCHADNVDAVSQGSCEVSGGNDYWFMRWNRPLRSDLQKNSCNCSFRKSPANHVQESNPILSTQHSYVSGNTAPVISRKTENLAVSNGVPNLETLSETQPQSVLVEGTQGNSRSIVSENHDLPVSSNNIACVGTDSANSCDIDLSNIKFTLNDPDVNDTGIVNPVFLASNDSLDCIVQKDPQVTNCDNASSFDEESVVSNKIESLNGNSQDHNANVQLKELNSQNFVSQPSISNDDNVKHVVEAGRIRHRKHCNVGPKAFLKKPLLFFVHGAGSNAEVWRGLMYQMVHSGYECVAPDTLGHGLSSAPDSASSYTFHSLLQDLLGIFDRYVTGGRHAVIIGHGYGCSIAAAMARYRAEQVVQLVLISGGGPTPLAPRIPQSVSPCLRCCLEPLLMCGFKRDVVYSVCGKQIEPCSPEECAIPRHILEHVAQGHVWPEGDAAFHRRIASPTLLVHGMQDQHITLVQQCEMERTIPRSFLEIIPEAGHWAMIETPDHLSHMILCFINWWAPTSNIH